MKIFNLYFVIFYVTQLIAFIVYGIYFLYLYNLTVKSLKEYIIEIIFYLITFAITSGIISLLLTLIKLNT